MKPENKNYWVNRPLNDTRRDWNEQGDNWVDDYRVSVDHPHRKLILEALDSLQPFNSILEIGCNVGPNLMAIEKKYPEVSLGGIDVNADAVSKANQLLPEADIKIGEVEAIPFDDKSYDIVLADAVLIYIGPSAIKTVIFEMNRIAKKGIILCEWDAKSKEGVITDGHWARDYASILESLDYDVKKFKIKKEEW